MEILLKGDDTGFSDGDLDLAAAAPELAQTIAGMKWEWRSEFQNDSGERCRSFWRDTESKAEKDLRLAQSAGYNARLVRRLVGPVEVAE